MDKRTLLKQYFGHSEFRPGQEPLVDALLSGRDVLGVMPTGAGKSVCYQLPALLLPGMALVISPLISLMKDQVAALTQAGVPAAYLNSSLDAGEFREVCRQVRRGECKLLYAAPERLQAEGFRRLLDELPISLLAVDEAHCVSQWGQDFRPSYLAIAELLASLPARPPVGAFTATATAAVRRDIEDLLTLRAPLRIDRLRPAQPVFRGGPGQGQGPVAQPLPGGAERPERHCLLRHAQGRGRGLCLPAGPGHPRRPVSRRDGGPGAPEEPGGLCL